MKKIKSIILLLILLTSGYSVYFFGLNVPIPYSEKAQWVNALYRDVSLVIFIFCLFLWVRRK